MQRLVQRHADGELIGDLTKLPSGRIGTVGCHSAHAPGDRNADPDRTHQHRQSIGELLEECPQTPLFAPAVELADHQDPDQRQRQQRRGSHQGLCQHNHQAREQQRRGHHDPPGERIEIQMRGIECHQPLQPLWRMRLRAVGRAGVALMARIGDDGARIGRGVLFDAFLDLAAALFRLHERDGGEAARTNRRQAPAS